MKQAVTIFLVGSDVQISHVVRIDPFIHLKLGIGCKFRDMLRAVDLIN